MQDRSIAFGRVSRATFSANPELRAHVAELVERAHFNLHGTSIANADAAWASAITAAAMQLCMDLRAQSLSTRELVHLFENVIRISDEHHREAKRHAAMASNVFYLKETALDAALSDHAAPLNLQQATTVVGLHLAHTGRLRTASKNDSDA